MDFIIIIVVIISIVARIAGANKAKQAAQQNPASSGATVRRPLRQDPAQVADASAAQVGRIPRPAFSPAPPRFGESDDLEGMPNRIDDSAEGDFAEGVSAEGVSAYVDTDLYEPDTSLGSAHAHQETSISGIEPECAPTLHQTVRSSSDDQYGIEELSDTKKLNPIVQGIIFAEIIGKPKALRG